MSDYDEILPVTEAKRDLLRLVKRINAHPQSIALTRNGRPAAVLLGRDEYEGLLETLEILSDPATARLVRKSLKELDAGKSVDHETVWK